MATNYYTKSEVSGFLAATNILPNIADQILKGLGAGKTGLMQLNTTTVTAHDVDGWNTVIINTAPDTTTPVTADLSHITKSEIQGVHNLVFNTDNDVTLNLGSDTNKLAFTGVVSTGGGADDINIFSTKSVLVSSGEGNDTVTTGSGNDTVNAGSGNDSISTGLGNDSVNAGAGDDSVTTGLGNDTVNAGAGNDSVDTGAGNDSVSTGLGNDTVSTGLGNDTVYVGSGSDSIDTGAGNDIVKLAAGFTGGQIDYNGANVALEGGDGKDTLDLRLVHIISVEDQSGSADLMQDFHITLDDGTIIDAKNFEKFIYDSSTTDTDGSIQIVGAHEFHTHDFGA